MTCCFTPPRFKRPRLLLIALPLPLLPLSAAAQSQNHLYTFHGAPWDYFGVSVAAAGDVNKDGYADVLVGAPQLANNLGSAYVFSGNDGTTLLTLRGKPGEFFGSCVSGAGDMNADGYPDLLVAAGYTNLSAVRAFSGKDGKLLYTFRGGTSLSHAGDVNRDGYHDVIIGDPGANQGSAWVYSGKTGRILHTFNGDHYCDLFGQSVAAAGDVNNDGYDDLIVGAIEARCYPYFGAGYARVFSGKDGNTLHTFRGEARWDSFGIAVSGVGDINGDRYGDVLVGATVHFVNSFKSGYVQAFSGRDGKILHTFRGTSLGAAVAGAGDVDADGSPDLILGAAWPTPLHTVEWAFVHSGNSGKLLYCLRPDKPGTSFGKAVAGAGDVNRDGHADVIVGAPSDPTAGAYSGRAQVFSGARLSLTTNTHFLSLSKGGVQTFRLHSNASHAAKPYLLLGSMSGTKFGLRLGNVTLPLYPFDTYFGLTLAHPNSWIENSRRNLDSAGSATATLRLSPGLPVSLIGTRLHHAYLVFRANPLRFDLASNPVPLTLQR